MQRPGPPLLLPRRLLQQYLRQAPTLPTPVHLARGDPSHAPSRQGWVWRVHVPRLPILQFHSLQQRQMHTLSRRKEHQRRNPRRRTRHPHTECPRRILAHARRIFTHWPPDLPEKLHPSPRLLQRQSLARPGAPRNRRPPVPGLLRAQVHLLQVDEIDRTSRPLPTQGPHDQYQPQGQRQLLPLPRPGHRI